MSTDMPSSIKEAQFALQALMEIPLQFTAIQGLGILGNAPRRFIPQFQRAAGLNPVVQTFDHFSGYDVNQVKLLDELMVVQFHSFLAQSGCSIAGIQKVFKLEMFVFLACCLNGSFPQQVTRLLLSFCIVIVNHDLNLRRSVLYASQKSEIWSSAVDMR
jgi:hypothetical protein